MGWSCDFTLYSLFFIFVSPILTATLTLITIELKMYHEVDKTFYYYQETHVESHSSIPSMYELMSLLSYLFYKHTLISLSLFSPTPPAGWNGKGNFHERPALRRFKPSIHPQPVEIRSPNKWSWENYRTAYAHTNVACKYISWRGKLIKKKVGLTPSKCLSRPAMHEYSW